MKKLNQAAILTGLTQAMQRSNMKFFIKSKYGSKIAEKFGTVTIGSRRFVTSMSGEYPDIIEDGYILETTLSKKELREKGLMVSHTVHYGMVL